MRPLNYVLDSRFGNFADYWGTIGIIDELELLPGAVRVVVSANFRGITNKIQRNLPDRELLFEFDYEVISGVLLYRVFGTNFAPVTGAGRIQRWGQQPGVNLIRFVSTGGAAEFIIGNVWLSEKVIMPVKNTQATIQIEDFSREKSTTSINVQNINTGGVNYASVEQDVDELKDAILTVTLGEVRHVEITKRFPESVATVTETSAQREEKWLVTMKDTLSHLDGGAGQNPNPGYGQLFSFEIACPDTQYLIDGQDYMDLEAATPAAFVASLEANARSPWNNNPAAAVTPTQEVVSVKLVGRRL